MRDLIEATLNNPPPSATSPGRPAGSNADTVDSGQPYHRLSAANLRDGYVVIMRPQRLDPRHDDSRYWSGPLAPDCFVSWLRYEAPNDGTVSVPEDQTVFTTHLDATTAWADYLADRRRRGTPLNGAVIEVVALHSIPDLTTVPPFGASRWRKPAS